MTSRRGLERRLAALSGFARPRVELEQYPTPPDIAAHVVHLADLQGDLDGTVIDLGTGTGVLALGSALRRPERVVGLERDPDAIGVALDNERDLDPPVRVSWLRGDATRPPLRISPRNREDVTVVMNPPFGAQDGNLHADRAFLATASRLARVSYSIHNSGSREFVEAFASDRGGEITRAFEARLDLERRFAFHTADREELRAEVFRIEWGG